MNQVAPVQPVMVTAPPIVHVVPQVEDPIYHTAPSENPDVHKRMDGFHDQFQELQKELKAMKGGVFGENSYDLCLVPNVKIPIKFKVPKF